MSERRIALLILGFLMLTLGLTYAFMELRRAIGPNPLSMAIAITVITCGTAIIAVVMRGLFKEKKHSSLSAVACLAAFGCLVGWVLGNNWAMARCGAWALIEGTKLKGITATRGLEIREGAPNLTPLTDLLSSEVGNRLVDHYCGCLTSKMVNQARQNPPAPDDAWETVGPYTLARRRDLWTGRVLLLGIIIPSPDNEWSWTQFGTGYLDSISVENVMTSRALMDLQRHIDNSAALGAPLPDDLISKLSRRAERRLAD